MPNELMWSVVARRMLSFGSSTFFMNFIFKWSSLQRYLRLSSKHVALCNRKLDDFVSVLTTSRADTLVIIIYILIIFFSFRTGVVDFHFKIVEKGLKSQNYTPRCSAVINLTSAFFVKRNINLWKQMCSHSLLTCLAVLTS